MLLLILISLFTVSHASHVPCTERSPKCHASHAHPIHISVTDVDIKTDTVYWTSRIYKDDLLLGMYGKSVDMKILDDRLRVEKGIFEYLTRNVSLAIDGKTIKWELNTIDSDPEAIWITLHSPFAGDITTDIILQNRILMDVYKDQKNIVNLAWTGGKKNFVFESPKEKKGIRFQ